MLDTVAARARRYLTSNLRPAADRVTLAGFLAACGGLLAVIALRGYTIYG